MLPIRTTVQLSRGSAVLRAWPATVADALLLDLLTFTATLTTVRDEWHAYARRDIEPGVWGAFWRLVQASLEPGARLPRPLTWDDRLTLLLTMYQLNDVEASEGKLRALTSHAGALLTRIRATRIQGQMTPPSMN